VLDVGPAELRDVAMATNSGTQFAIFITGFVGHNFGCVIASDTLFDSRVTPIYKFWVIIHVFGTGDVRVFKFSKKNKLIVLSTDLTMTNRLKDGVVRVV